MRIQLQPITRLALVAACLLTVSTTEAAPGNGVPARLSVLEQSVERIAVALPPPGSKHVELTTRQRGDTSRCVLEPYSPFHEIQQDGSIAPLEYVTPLGYDLRILDVRWSGDSATAVGLPLGGALVFHLVAPSAVSGQSSSAYESRPIPVTVAGLLTLGDAENLTAGAHVGAGRALCGWVQIRRSDTESASFAQPRATLRGLLIPQGN